jgi:hypothetical protein
MKQMPVLMERVYKDCKQIEAAVVMAKETISLPSIADMSSIETALTSSHAAFPVLNTEGNLVGMMPRNILIRLLEKKAWYD